MQRFCLSTLLATSIVVLAACGQKGPLYLPNKPQAQPPSAVQSSQAEERSNSSKDADSAEPGQ
ncbi:MAG: lipoprotein [Pseudomonadota bacterium]